MQHDDTVAIRHILAHALEAVALAATRLREDLDRDRQFFLSVLKLVEIVGEAANRVSSATQSLHPQIPWSLIVAARNRLVHGYDSVDCDVLWDIVKLDFPALAAELEKLLAGADSPA
ncbi:DUF86 domain-containing protein [Candidatus Poribacteria bacterium]|nr:DUF86 domain-containing protein [Candidatus Poribacteria bacterium]